METEQILETGLDGNLRLMDKPIMLYFNPTTPHDPDVYTALFNFTLLDTPAGEIESLICSVSMLWCMSIIIASGGGGIRQIDYLHSIWGKPALCGIFGGCRYSVQCSRLWHAFQGPDVAQSSGGSHC